MATGGALRFVVRSLETCGMLDVSICIQSTFYCVVMGHFGGRDLPSFLPRPHGPFIQASFISPRKEKIRKTTTCTCKARIVSPGTQSICSIKARWLLELMRYESILSNQEKRREPLRNENGRWRRRYGVLMQKKNMPPP